MLYENIEKGKRAAELLIANKELAFQNEEKSKRAAELLIANKELAFQNEEKEKRAIELALAVEELEKAKLEIIELNIGLEQKVVERTIQLKAANKELEAFSYSVSHDLRSPLRAINGFTQVLMEDYADKIDDEGKSVMKEIVSNSNKMGQLIDNLLEFSHIGKQNICAAIVGLGELVQSVLLELKQQEPTGYLSITVKPLGLIMGDRAMLKQVFINLISNAFKYTGKLEKPIIEIGSYPENNQTVIYVKDNGAGFDMRYYGNLFGVFQRLHSTNEFEGTGVGLAIIQRIIFKHSGKVWAEAKVNEGACFYISLPTSI